jgi:hypothetical protein
MTSRLLLTLFLIVSMASSQTAKKQPAAQAAADPHTAACDCSIYPIHPESCVKICGQMSGRVVGITSDHITLAVKKDDKTEEKTFVLKPALHDKLNIKPDTQVTVTYNKSNQVVQSVTAK